MAQKVKQTLSESLVQRGIIQAETMRDVEREARSSGDGVREILLRKGLISESDMTAFISKLFDLPQVDLTNYLIEPQIIALIPIDLARKYQVVPILKIAGNLTVAMADPLDVFALDELQARTGLTIEPVVAAASEIRKAIDEQYGAKGSIEEVLRDMHTEQHDRLRDEHTEAASGADEAPVIKLVNLMIMDAVGQGASDVHIEPEEETLRIRFRVDGVLHERAAPEKFLQSSLISRLKIMANLDIAENRVPQDGRIQMKMEGRDIDIRVSCVPTMYGENVVMRLLDRQSAIVDLRKLGFSEDIFAKYEQLVYRPHGIILVTGPTGSGKTTTLYASLNMINSEDKNIVTIEDPIEYHLPGVRQMQVNAKVHLIFANGLRSILRQDPDVIMVGEIRDRETAEIAIQAALTGHLVFSSLHTNDAPGAITRLLDMGVEPFLLSSSIIGVLAQRLVRTLCHACEGKGCKECMETKYRGRTGIFELMVPDEAIRQLIMKKAPADQIRHSAVRAGMRLLRDDGRDKVASGKTVEEEVMRVTEEV